MNAFLLILAILLPFIFSITLCFILKKESPLEIKGWSNVFSIRENKWLLSQPLFWCSLLIPACLFISFGLFSWKEYEIVMTGEGFNKFLEISKLPLWLLAIAAPFSVVVARAHGTAQTAYQINELEIKNNQENYYRHRDDVIQTLNEALQEYLKTTKSVVNSEELPDQIIRSSLYQRLFTSTEK